MSAVPETSSTQSNAAPTEKEFNFRKLEDRYEKMLQEERQKRIEAEAMVKRYSSPQEDDDDGDSEPYVDKRRLKKEFTNFEKKSKEATQSDIQRAVDMALEKERQESWIENNPDFYDVMKDAELLAKKAPNTAKTILRMPEGFERQKLVYNAIKELGVNKKEEAKVSIQDEIKNNKKPLYYSPSGVGSAPYSSQGDFSDGGQKTAYNKMQELKGRLRLG